MTMQKPERTDSVLRFTAKEMKIHGLHVVTNDIGSAIEQWERQVQVVIKKNRRSCSTSIPIKNGIEL